MSTLNPGSRGASAGFASLYSEYSRGAEPRSNQLTWSAVPPVCLVGLRSQIAYKICACSVIIAHARAYCALRGSPSAFHASPGGTAATLTYSARSNSSRNSFLKSSGPKSR